MLVPSSRGSRRRSASRRGRLAGGTPVDPGGIGRFDFVEWGVPRRQPVVTGAAPAAWTTSPYAGGRVAQPHTDQISAARLQQLMSGLASHHGPCAP
jgi:hypothetical protein